MSGEALAGERREPDWRESDEYVLVDLPRFVIGRDEVRSLFQEIDTALPADVVVLDLSSNITIAPSAIDEFAKVTFGERGTKEVVVIPYQPDSSDSEHHPVSFSSRQFNGLSDAARRRYGDEARVSCLDMGRQEVRPAISGNPSLLNGSNILSKILEES